MCSNIYIDESNQPKSQVESIIVESLVIYCHLKTDFDLKATTKSSNWNA